MSVLIISIGTATTCSFTPEISILGLMVMLMSEATEAVRLVMTQFLLQNLKFGVIEGNTITISIQFHYNYNHYYNYY